ncbi:hypothetical protein GQ54DRAFT_39549 [Martensiomyces pterosporus]|nr:hypothetical protein GQ54DRAFT_39549 [Martensiomyces pterosporus]
MAYSENKGERRLAPNASSLDTRVQRSYKGKIVKQRIERNHLSNVKRKFFRTVKREGESGQNDYFKGLVTTSERGKSYSGKAKSGSNHSTDNEQGGNETHSGKNAEPSGRNAQEHQRQPRANPYQKILKEREQEKEHREEERRQREREMKQTEKRRSKYKHDRKVQRKKHNAKTSRGQPVLSNQIDHLLSKIKKG